MLSFVGIYILLLGGFVYNFYLSKKLYKLLDNMVEVMSITAGLKAPDKEGTMKKLLREGMELQEEGEEETTKGLLGRQGS